MNGIKRMTGTERSLVLLAGTIVLLLLCVNGMLIAARGGAGERIASAQADYPRSLGLDVPTMEVTATVATTATGTITATGTVTGTIPATSTPTQCIIVATLTPTGTISATATLTTTATPSASATALITATVVATEVIDKETNEGGSANAPQGPPRTIEATAIATATPPEEATGTATAGASASATPTSPPGSATPTPACIVVTPTPCDDPDCASPTPCNDPWCLTSTPTDTPGPTDTPTPCADCCETPTPCPNLPGMECASPTPSPSPTGTRIPLRYLAINVGNVNWFSCLYLECKLSDPAISARIKNYIAYWQPDVVMVSEVLMKEQLKGIAYDNGHNRGGPILPDGYDGICGESRHRVTGALADWNTDDSSHEHECIGWKTSRVSMVAGSKHSEYGRNDAWGKLNCDYDFTAFGVSLRLMNKVTFSAVAVHPDSGSKYCRIDEIYRYWRYWGTGAKTIIGGDWNTEDWGELQVPTHRGFGTPPNYSLGQHFNIAYHPDEYTAFYEAPAPDRKLDHAFSNFGMACTNCGHYYGTRDLTYGSAVGGYDGHPKADGPSGMDHRQILVDLLVQP